MLQTDSASMVTPTPRLCTCKTFYQERCQLDDEQVIESIWWWNEHGDNSVRVGRDGVTQIKLTNEFHGDHDLNWYVVYKGEVVAAKHNERYVSSVYYARGKS